MYAHVEENLETTYMLVPVVLDLLQYRSHPKWANICKKGKNLFNGPRFLNAR